MSASFREAVEATRGLESAYQQGLQALRSRDRGHVEPEDPRCLSGSVDIDSAYAALEPNAHRWDYAIGYRHTDRSGEVVYWVEMHTASDGETGRVIDKARWLLAWFGRSGTALGCFERDIVWVSSGSTHLTPTAPQKKVMATLGLRQVGGQLRIPSRRNR
ncbi:MAG: hypothetical protein IT384_26675 [Deltaproteobacteria bacterium]|nr:hypothetical protein [Deltaproteobacteria bacterium]